MKKRTSKQQLLKEQNELAITLGILLPIVMLLSPGVWIVYLSLTRQSAFHDNAFHFVTGALMCIVGCIVIGLAIHEIHDNNKSSKQSL